jgi:heavy metal sensor kinase
MRKPETLRGRLAAWYAAVLAVTLLAFAASVYFLVEDDEGEAPAAQISVNGEPPEHVGRRLLIALAVALPGALAIAIAGGLWITRRSLRPLDEVARVAEELGAERLDQRVELPEDAAAELKQLAHAFNGMLARLDRSVAGMRRFTTDASHELRTPLAALRGELEVTLRRPRSADELRRGLETALEEVGRLSELVEGLLTMARADAGELALKRASADVCEIVRRVVAPYEAVAADRGLALEVSADGPLAALVDDTWLGRAVANLVDNACKYTPAGGKVRVEARRADGRVRIEVADNGPGLLPEDEDRLFERFYRGRGARAFEGFGLGLALARDIVRGLGGTLTAHPTSGGGATFRIEL